MDSLGAATTRSVPITLSALSAAAAATQSTALLADMEAKGDGTATLAALASATLLASATRRSNAPFRAKYDALFDSQTRLLDAQSPDESGLRSLAAPLTHLTANADKLATKDKTKALTQTKTMAAALKAPISPDLAASLLQSCANVKAGANKGSRRSTAEMKAVSDGYDAAKFDILRKTVQAHAAGEAPAKISTGGDSSETLSVQRMNIDTMAPAKHNDVTVALASTAALLKNESAGVSGHNTLTKGCVDVHLATGGFFGNTPVVGQASAPVSVVLGTAGSSSPVVVKDLKKPIEITVPAYSSQKLSARVWKCKSSGLCAWEADKQVTVRAVAGKQQMTISTPHLTDFVLVNGTGSSGSSSSSAVPSSSATPSKTYAVRATLSISGVTAAQFNQVKVQSAFKTAVAASVKGASASDVTIVSFKTVTTRRASALEVVFTIAVSSNAEASAAVNALTAEIKKGDFAKTFKDEAAKVGVALDPVVTVMSMEVTGGPKKDEGSGSGVVWGIIGLIVGLSLIVLVGGYIWYTVCWSGKKKPATTTGSLEKDQKMDEIEKRFDDLLAQQEDGTSIQMRAVGGSDTAGETNLVGVQTNPAIASDVPVAVPVEDETVEVDAAWSKEEQEEMNIAAAAAASVNKQAAAKEQQSLEKYV